jgi:hypothetical protein
MSSLRGLILTLLVLTVARHSSAADAYFISFAAAGRPSTAGGQVLWGDQVVFFNTNAVPVEVRFLGISNVPPPANPSTLMLPPGRLIIGYPENWHPGAVTTLAVLHLDIPSGVVVDSQDQFYFQRNLPDIPAFALGKASMPIFREVTPAGKPHVHLGTDLNGSDPSRVNVGIYNAGSETAAATIEIHVGCDDSVVDRRVLSIPPNTLIQTNGMRTGSATCGIPGYTNLPRYTVITVSQPSLTYVSNINESINRASDVAGAAPFVGLAVAHNTKF